MSEGPKAHPFQQWVDLAKPRAQLWRTAVGVILVSLAWFAWSMVLILVAVGIGLVKPEAFQAMFGTADIPLTYLDTVVMLLIALATIWGFSFGVWAVVKLLHKRQLDTVVGWNRRFSLSQFGAGCIIAAGYLAVSMTWSFVSGNAPRRSALELGTWLIALGPIALVVSRAQGSAMKLSAGSSGNSARMAGTCSAPVMTPPSSVSLRTGSPCSPVT